MAMARRARERVLAEHTYAHRMQALIDFVASTRPGWPHRDEEAPDGLPADMDEDLRRELAGLLERLELPPDTAFKDLVWAVRQQHGELSELETALLFLDEWRKQYGRPD
jgi:spore maturation protein CgeB